jgi:hypothetical protein
MRVLDHHVGRYDGDGCGPYNGCVISDPALNAAASLAERRRDRVDQVALAQAAQRWR